MFELTLKLILSIVSFGAMIILNYAIFRIEIKGNDKQIALMAVIIGSINFYFKFVLGSPYFSIAQLFATIVLFTILRKYPILFSLIVSVIGAFVFSITDSIVSFSAMALNLSTLDKMLNNFKHYIILHLIMTSIYLIIALIFVKYKIGFSFVIRRFTGMQYLKTYNFIWALILIVAMISLQFTVKGFQTNNLHLYIVLFLSILFVVLIVYTYIQNKKVVRERYIIDKAGDNSEYSRSDIK